MEVIGRYGGGDIGRFEGDNTERLGGEDIGILEALRRYWRNLNNFKNLIYFLKFLNQIDFCSHFCIAEWEAKKS